MSHANSIRALLLAMLGLVTGFVVGWEDSPNRRSVASESANGHAQPVFQVPAEWWRAGSRDRPAEASGTNRIQLADVKSAIVQDMVGRNPCMVWSHFQNLAARIGSNDYPAVLVMAEETIDGHSFVMLAESIVTRWSTKDPKDAVAFVCSLRSAWARQRLLHIPVAAWVLQDRAGFLAFVSQLPAGRERNEVMVCTIRPLSSRDPQAALAVAKKLPSATLRRNATLEIARHWLYSDMPAAVTWILTLPDGTQKYEIIGTFGYFNYGKDPIIAYAAMATALNVLPVHHPCYRSRLIEVADGWAGCDPASAMAWVQKLPLERGRNVAFQRVLPALARCEPDTAMALARTLPAGEAHDRAIVTMSDALAARNPNLALDLVLALTNGPRRAAATTNLVWRLNYADTNAALRLLADLTDAELRDTCLCRMAQATVATNPERALQWAAQVVDESARLETTEVLVRRWSVVAPQLAARYAVTLPGGPNLRLLNQIAVRWAQLEPDKALSWAAGLPVDSPPYPLVTALRTMATATPEKAAKYVCGLPAGTLHSNAVKGVALAWAHHDPRGAAQWSARLATEELRMVAYHVTVRCWYQRNAVAAREWVEALPRGKLRDAAISAICIELRLGNEQRARQLLGRIQDEGLRKKTATAVSASYSGDPFATPEYLFTPIENPFVVPDDPFTTAADPFATATDPFAPSSDPFATAESLFR